MRLAGVIQCAPAKKVEFSQARERCSQSSMETVLFSLIGRCNAPHAGIVAQKLSSPPTFRFLYKEFTSCLRKARLRPKDILANNRIIDHLNDYNSHYRSHLKHQVSDNESFHTQT